MRMRRVICRRNVATGESAEREGRTGGEGRKEQRGVSARGVGATAGKGRERRQENGHKGFKGE
jgi:hypothetical protein